MADLIDRAVTRKAVRDVMAAMEWPPADGDAQIDAVLGAIAALPAALDGVDERAGEVLEGVTPLAGWLRNPWSKSDSVERGPIPEWLAALLFEAASKLEASSDLITALLAQIAALRAERDALAKAIDPADNRPALMARIIMRSIENDSRADAAEATVATLTAQVEAMRGALRRIEAMDTMRDMNPAGQRPDHIGPFAKIARAALTTENQNG